MASELIVSVYERIITFLKEAKEHAKICSLALAEEANYFPIRFMERK